MFLISFQFSHGLNKSKKAHHIMDFAMGLDGFWTSGMSWSKPVYSLFLLTSAWSGSSLNTKAVNQKKLFAIWRMMV